MKAATQGNWSIIGYKKQGRFEHTAIMQNSDTGEIKTEAEMKHDGTLYYYVELDKYTRGIVVH